MDINSAPFSALNPYQCGIFIMKVIVTLWVGGRTFDEVVNVPRFEDAVPTALARNPAKGVVVVNRKIVMD